MSAKYVRAVVVGFAIAFVISGVLGFLAGASGRAFGFTDALPGLLIGMIAAYVMANLAGNRKVAVADAGAAVNARAMQPPPDKALVYAFRDGFVGMAAGLDVKLDGVDLAQLTSPRFTCLAVESGRHTLSASFGGLAGAQNRPVAIDFTVSPGQVHVFRFGVEMGALKNGVSVERVDTEQARGRLARMKMVQPDGPALF